LPEKNKGKKEQISQEKGFEEEEKKRRRSLLLRKGDRGFLRLWVMKILSSTI